MPPEEITPSILRDRLRQSLSSTAFDFLEITKIRKHLVGSRGVQTDEFEQLRAFNGK
jgi:hypothetical protein